MFRGTRSIYPSGSGRGPWWRRMVEKIRGWIALARQRIIRPRSAMRSRRKTLRTMGANRRQTWARRFGQLNWRWARPLNYSRQIARARHPHFGSPGALTKDQKSKPKRKKNLGAVFSRRAALIGAGQLGLFGLLAVRLHKLQVIDGKRYKVLADENRISLRLVPPVRGRVFDRMGKLLAANKEDMRVMVIPDLSRDLSRTLDELGKVVNVPVLERQRVLNLARKQNPQLPILVTGGLSWEQFAKINVLAPQMPGVHTDIGWRREYFHSRVFGHIMGYLGAATRVQLAESPVLRLPGLRVGVSGVEEGYETLLRGQPGNAKIEVDARGRVVRQLDYEGATPGRDIILTIEQALQKRTLERIAKFRRAAIVAMDVNNGDVLAMASTPTYDPNDIVHGISVEKWRSLQTAEDDPLTNKATRGQYPPGSTFKMVTALAGLEAGVITPKTRFWCSGAFKYSNHVFHCWRRSGHRGVRLHRALKESCDVYFYETAKRLGIKRLAVMARKLGLGQSYDCGLPKQKPGVVPDPDWKRATLGKPWYGGETVLAGIGQGFVLTTPLQLAVMTARIASGKKILPRLARTVPPQKPVPAEKLDISEASLKLVRKGMYAVVNEPGGTAGRSAFYLAGARMAGKTGTSQVRGFKGRRRSNAQLEWHERDHALFVCYAPARKPKYCVSVIVEHGEGGSKTAAPLAREVMLDLLRQDPAANPGYTPKTAPKRTVRGREPLTKSDKG